MDDNIQKVLYEINRIKESEVLTKREEALMESVHMLAEMTRVAMDSLESYDDALHAHESFFMDDGIWSWRAKTSPFLQ